MLRTLSDSEGCIADLAAKLGVSPQFCGDVIAGRKHAGPKLLGSLNARVEKVYIVEISQGEEATDERQ